MKTSQKPTFVTVDGVIMTKAAAKVVKDFACGVQEDMDDLRESGPLAFLSNMMGDDTSKHDVGMLEYVAALCRAEAQNAKARKRSKLV